LQTKIGSHVSEDMLMGYSFGHLPEHALADLEEHILMCEACQLHLEAVDEHLRTAAEAAREIREEGKRRKKTRLSSWLLGGPRVVWSCVLATIFIFAFAPLLRQAATLRKPTAEVLLTASRGAEQALVSHTQAGNVTLKIDTSELPNLPAYQLQLVDAGGREIWSGSGLNIRQQIRATLPHPLGPGQYWVRLLTPDQNQVREFGLAIQ
jgi:hypothetical protein